MWWNLFNIFFFKFWLKKIPKKGNILLYVKEFFFYFFFIIFLFFGCICVKFCTNKGCQAWSEELVRVNQHILQNGCCMDTKHFFHCIHVPWQITMVSYVLLATHSLFGNLNIDGYTWVVYMFIFHIWFFQKSKNREHWYLPT
jgi:hypothetical protein